jgi:hypothetical protein
MPLDDVARKHAPWLAAAILVAAHMDVTAHTCNASFRVVNAILELQQRERPTTT